jgi:hypothetical protein
LVIHAVPEGEIPATAGAVSGLNAPAEGSADLQLIPLKHIDAPTRLGRIHRYLICDPWRVIAFWENNGQGWRIRTDYGFTSAARSPEKIPNQGDFKLVELRMAVLRDELRLKGIQVYQLQRHWALAGLGRADDLVCKSIVGLGSLLRAQKDAVRLQLQERFMRTIWGDAQEVLDYLSNDDYHSPGAGE